MSKDEAPSKSPVVVGRRPDGVAIVTLNRPEKMNALSTALREQFSTALAQLEADDAVKVVVLTGAGERAFSAGADLDEVGKRSAFERRRVSKVDPANLVRRMEKPVIAMMRGYVLGGGAELAAGCDIRIAGESAVIGYPEIGHGWLPLGGGGTQSLPRIVGLGRAMILVLSGERITAQQAREYGFVDEVYPDSELESRTLALATKIASHRLEPIILGKAALRAAEELPLTQGLAFERELSTITYHFEGRKEALAAFQDRKRD